MRFFFSPSPRSSLLTATKLISSSFLVVLRVLSILVDFYFLTAKYRLGSLTPTGPRQGLGAPSSGPSLQVAESAIPFQLFPRFFLFLFTGKGVCFFALRLDWRSPRSRASGLFFFGVLLPGCAPPTAFPICSGVGLESSSYRFLAAPPSSCFLLTSASWVLRYHYKDNNGDFLYPFYSC